MKTKDRYLLIKQKLDASFDCTFDEFKLNDRGVYLIYLSSLSSMDAVSALIQGFLMSENKSDFTFFNGSISPLKNESEAITQILSGQCIVMFDEDEQIYSIETRHYPTRSIHAAENEKSVRGSSDAFVENIINNVGLIRRRIRDERLRIELVKEGLMCKCDIAILSMKGIVDEDVKQDFMKRLSQNQDVEIYNDRNLIEALYGKTYNPYPHVRYSERPDLCALHLLQGYLIVIVDNIPMAMIMPTTFFEQLQQAEEYTQTPLIAFSTRIIRYLGVLCSLYLMPFFVVINATANPTMMNIPLLEVKPFEFGFQIIFAEIMIEWIRLSLIHSPTLLSGIMGFLVVFVLGDFGIELGAVTKEVLVVVAICNLGNLMTPSYEISLANKFSRVALTLVALFFKWPGLCLGLGFHFYLLIRTKTIKYPYLYPLIPFSYQECKRLLFGELMRDKKQMK